ncbi:TPA: hypothetical protein HA235_06675 [Candidatus Woesearchaeota archaeon]|nr:hypothetical protein [uncultured archaeon]MBS3172821.1 hypothetical protein [Candidatus Woesearchaeota archaeon]HIH32361.1 hypothetical protein [Candidatus Woesearchaeota archaeon]HIH54540.1 hypothetical protein [Candidatus Woesearchaeota archaeon]HIJ02238.1 hypothetical protein [Candidatus Woesearchaeota archaeon]
MKTQLDPQLRKEIINVLLCVITLIIITQIAYFKENFLAVSKISLSIAYLYIIPGYALMLYWFDKIPFFQRLFFGTSIGIGVVGFLSYYIGMAGIHIKYHHIIFPPVLIIIGILGYVMQKKK